MRALALLAACLLVPSFAGAVLPPPNLVVNGTFDANAAGWTATTVDVNGGFRISGGNPGGQFILNSNGALLTDPTIAQTIPGLVVNTTYRLDWNYRSAHFGTGNASRISFGVFANNALLFESADPGVAWTAQSTCFVPSTSSIVLSFRGERNGDDTSYGLDNIAMVQALPFAVPFPLCLPVP